MSNFWKTWLKVWCGGVALFGLVLMTAAFPATDAPVRLLFAFLNGPGEFAPDAYLRFSLALMGAVSLGWAITFAVAMQAAHMLGHAAGPVWSGITTAIVVWFVIDSALSVLTGFPMNVLPNVVLLAGYLVPILASGAMRPSLQAA